MAHWLAIDWNASEARYVVGTTRGGRLKLESAGTLSIESGLDAEHSPARIGEMLRKAIAGQAGRPAAIVGVDRSQIELVALALPPASDAELPELVRNQAMRENAAIGDDYVLDFVATSVHGADPRKVMAAALSKARLEQIRAVLSASGAAPKAIVLRPYATAGLVLESLEDRDAACLVINVLADEVDLIVLAGGEVVFWRTLRQSNVSHDAVAARRLLPELGRTLAVAQAHLAGRTVEAAYLCGGLDEHPALVELLRRESPLALTLVDPFAAHGGLTEPPQSPGRFASLVGMLAMEAAGGAHPINFLKPRKRPAPPDRRRTMVLAGAAAALIVLLAGYRVWSTRAEADQQIESLSAELDGLDDQLKRAGQKQKAIAAIGDWAAGDVNWLDELRDLSLRFPGGRDAMVSRMGLSHGRDAGGTIDMVGIVRDPAVVSHIENNLRDDHHQIHSRHMQERLEENNYTWHFESSIVVTPRKPEQYISHLPAGQRNAERPTETPSRAAGGTPPRSAAKGR